MGSELDTLIRIKNGRLRRTQRLVERCHTETTIECVGQLLGQHIPTVPIDDRHQIHEALHHWYIGDVRRATLDSGAQSPGRAAD
jgi:hypothetical protein